MNKTVSVIIVSFLLLVALPTAELQAETCVTSSCHSGMSQISLQHSPVAEGECDSCHVQISEQHPAKGQSSFELTEEGSALCFQCHEPFAQSKFQHSPVEEGDCIGCHNPHGSANPALLAVGQDQTALCTECHAPDMFSNKQIHGPVGMGACTECHNPHASAHVSLLKKSTTDTCVRCHAFMAEGIKTAKYVHPAVNQQSCIACHSPHSSPEPRLLNKPIKETCITCHQSVVEKMEGAKVKHAALYREESCGECHSSHFSDFPALLPAEQQDVCLECHGQDDHRTSTPLKNIAAELKDKANLHGPLSDGECSACHDPHGSDAGRLLKEAYPDSFYAPFSKDAYTFCLGCHEENLLRFADTSIYTNFRNGKQNLHYIHVVNKRKGRTCRVCHEPHASNADKLILEEGAKFGDWKVPVRFKQTDTGGSCAPGCHRALDYDRETPVDYSSTAK